MRSLVDKLRRRDVARRVAGLGRRGPASGSEIANVAAGTSEAPADAISQESVQFSRSLIEAAEEIGKPVEDVTAVDLLDYPREDLPDGYASPLGGEVPTYRRSKPESETRRIAEIGRAWVDDVHAAQERSGKR